MIGLVLLILVLGGLAALPWLAEQRREPSHHFRETAPGRFAKLSAGVTHYQWLGAKRGPVLVCIHGLTTPSPVWYAVAQELGRIGFRVLVYDLYGRGFSDAPKVTHNRDLFVNQLRDLLAHQDIQDDVTLIGFSMGGSIATAFAAAFPSRIRRLVLIATAGIWIREDNLTAWARKTPLFGDWVHHVVLARQDRKKLRAQLGHPFDISGIVEVQLAEYRSKGFLRAVLSSRRHALAEVQTTDHRNIGRQGIPVIGLWAEKDDVIPLKSLGTLTQCNRAVRQEVIAGADHRLLYTHASDVVDVLTDILRENAD